MRPGRELVTSTSPLMLLRSAGGDGFTLPARCSSSGVVAVVGKEEEEETIDDMNAVDVEVGAMGDVFLLERRLSIITSLEGLGLPPLAAEGGSDTEGKGEVEISVDGCCCEERADRGATAAAAARM
jgi:hypothetical protein